MSTILYGSTNNFEAALVSIVTKFGLDIREEKFLTVCGKCGAEIDTLEAVRKKVETTTKERIEGENDDYDSSNEHEAGGAKVWGAVCHYFQIGMCREGEACKYLHVIGGEGLTGAASLPPKSFDEGQKLQLTCAMSTTSDSEGSESLKLPNKGKVGSDLSYIPPDKPIYACVQCLQIYWWNDRSDSSPARAMRVAMKLLDMIKMSRSEKVKSGEANLSSSIYATGLKAGETGDEARKKHIDSLSVLFNKRDSTLMENISTDDTSEALSISILQSEVEKEVTNIPYVSTYTSVHNHGDSGHALTNWNKDFKDTLDYIFILKDGALRATKAQVIPRIVDNENDITENMLNHEWLILGRSQPSSDWPSDHFFVKVELELVH